MIFEDRKLHEALELEYVKLQELVDQRVSLILDREGRLWNINPREMTIPELQGAIRRMEIVLTASPRRLARIWGWLSRGNRDSDDYDGRGLA